MKVSGFEAFNPGQIFKRTKNSRSRK